VIKWNKQRNRLQEQVAFNKHKKNTGGINRSKEKYPLASKLFLAEFKPGD
jgi:hypothetical protein